MNELRIGATPSFARNEKEPPASWKTAAAPSARHSISASPYKYNTADIPEFGEFSTYLEEKMKKIYLVLSVLLVAGMVLAACGPQATATPVATEAPVVTEAPEEGATIVFSGWGDETEQQIYRDSIVRFNALYPDVIVDYQPIPADFQTKLKAVMAGGTPPMCSTSMIN